MAKKTITIDVNTYPDIKSADITAVKHEFIVRKVTDSTEYLPGQIVTKEDVDRLCEASVWAVTLTPSPNTQTFRRP